MIGPDGVAAGNDDAPGLGLNSRLRYTFPSDGVLQIEATSYLGNDTGAYELTIDTEGGDLAGEPGWREDDAQRIRVGSRQDGRLSSDSPLFENRPFDPYVVALREGQEVVVDMGAAEGSGLDTLLRMEGPDGQVWRNDDGGEGYNSRIELRAPARGDYRIWASTFSTRGEGEYYLIVRNRAAATGPDAASGPADASGSQTDAELLSSVTRRLDSRSERDRDDRLVETLSVELDAGRSYQISAESDEFSPRLAVLRDGAERASTRPGQGGQVNLVFTPDSSGEYDILVRSEEPDGRGTVRIRVIDPGSGD